MPTVGHGHEVQAGQGHLPLRLSLLELRLQRGNRCLLLLDVMSSEHRVHALGIPQGLDELERRAARLVSRASVSALSGLEPRVHLIDNVNTALATDYAAVAVPGLQGLQ